MGKTKRYKKAIAVLNEVIEDENHIIAWADDMYTSNHVPAVKERHQLVVDALNTAVATIHASLHKAKP